MKGVYLSRKEFIKQTYVILSMLFALKTSGAENGENSSKFDVVTCHGKNRFQYAHNTFNCVQDDSTSMCDNLGLFLANKRRCHKCCMATTTTTISPRPNQTVPITQRGTAAHLSGQKSPNQVYKIAVICTGSIFAVFAIIIVGVHIGKNQERWRMKIFGERGCGIPLTANIGEEENALGDIIHEGRALPVQEEAEILVSENTERHCVGMPIASSRETDV